MIRRAQSVCLRIPNLVVLFVRYDMCLLALKDAFNYLCRLENKSVSNKDDNDEKPSLDHSNATKKTELPNEISDQSGKASDEKRRRHAVLL